MAFLVNATVSSSSSSSSVALSPSSAAPHRKPSSPSRLKLSRSSLKPLLPDGWRDLTGFPQYNIGNTASPAPAPATSHLLKYYARLASKLAKNGNLRDFLMIAESVLTSDAVADNSPQFVARINPMMVSEGIASLLLDGKLAEVDRA